MSTQRRVNSLGKSATLAICLFVVVGCSTQDRFVSEPDAGAAGGGGTGVRAGSGGGQAGGAGGSAPDTTLLGAACTGDSDCGKLLCDREIKQQFMVSGAPDGQLDFSLFPGGSCTPLPLATFDPTNGTSCDPTEPRGSQGCGSEGACLIESVQGRTMVGCRKSCTPSATDSGCERAGYTCDFGDLACVEGCRSDTECRLEVVDTDGDGQPDSSAFDKSSQATCDAKTARCTHPDGGQSIGESCSSDDDCGSDAACIMGNTSLAGHRWPGGYCTRVGCEVKGRECGTGNVCEPVRPALDANTTDPLCLTRCTVGAEAEGLRRGASGHGEGCRDGYRCAYNGGSGAQSGVCVGGEYNDVAMNNIGSGCMANSDCYSPYGAGRCLHYALPDGKSSSGICTLIDCNVPGLPKGLCGEGNECVGSSADQALCEHNCENASQCPMGYACSDDDGDPSTSKICYPVCETADDCRSDERCQLYSMLSVGQCVLQ